VTEQISQPFERSQGSTPPTGLAVRFSCAGSVSHAVVNDAGGNGGQFWACGVMWRVRRMPPVNQKQPASKSCDVVMLQIKITQSSRTPKSASVGLDQATG